jgi:hypothetical protein
VNSFNAIGNVQLIARQQVPRFTPWKVPRRLHALATWITNFDLSSLVVTHSLWSWNRIVGHGEPTGLPAVADFSVGRILQDAPA